MADKTKIQWTEATWNPIAGCSKLSAGCEFCYAIDQAYGIVNRFGANPDHPGVKKYAGLTKVLANGQANWTGEVRFVEEVLMQPVKWKRPRKIFVNSMSDLFHEKLSDEQIARVLAITTFTPQHTYQILTKRAKRMYEFFQKDWQALIQEQGELLICEYQLDMKKLDWWFADTTYGDEGEKDVDFLWENNNKDILQNVWMGVSVENQKAADERVKYLQNVPAAVKWLSCEPLLGPVSLYDVFYDTIGDLKKTIDWVVIGGESGKNAREMRDDWLWNLVVECGNREIPVFVKQLGSVWAKRSNLKHSKGGDIEEFPGFYKNKRQFPSI